MQFIHNLGYSQIEKLQSNKFRFFNTVKFCLKNEVQAVASWKLVCLQLTSCRLVAIHQSCRGAYRLHLKDNADRQLPEYAASRGRRQQLSNVCTHTQAYLMIQSEGYITAGY